MSICPILLALALIGLVYCQGMPCELRETKYGSVCVCSSTRCDDLKNPTPTAGGDFYIVSSSKAGLRFSTKSGQFGANAELYVEDYNELSVQKLRETPLSDEFDPVAVMVSNDRSFVELIARASSGKFLLPTRTGPRDVKLEILRNEEYQKIVGFGGAFTGAVSHILQQIEPELQDQIYRSFFHEDGIAFNMLRISIGGCDFDLAPWAYNEQPRDDPHLTNFTKLSASDELKVHQLKRLKEIALLDSIKLMAAAWSAPPWMKSNNEWTGFSFLKSEYYQTWANYHLKFLELMDAKNMPIWAISTGNEPLNGVIGWFFIHFMSLGWTPTNQAIWLSENLGPTIRTSKYKDVLIFGNDDQRYTYPTWFNRMNSTRSNALDYLDGLAVHWYWDEVFAPNLIDSAHKDMPDKLLLNTESCVGDKPWDMHGPELGSWERGEKYSRAFLQDLQHSFNGWIDWNIILDEQGGPNYVKNYVDAPVIVNTINRTEFYKQPIFYNIGHFSKFIPEGSIRIGTHILDFNVDAVAFKRPDSSICAIITNSGTAPVKVSVTDSIRGAMVMHLPPKSIHTIIYK